MFSWGFGGYNGLLQKVCKKMTMQWRVFTTFLLFIYTCVQEKVSIYDYVDENIINTYYILSGLIFLVVAIYLKRAVFSKHHHVKEFSPLLVANFFSFVIGMMALPFIYSFLESLTTSCRTYFEEVPPGDIANMKMVVVGALVFVFACVVEFIRAICIARISSQMKASEHWHDIVVSKRYYYHSPAIFGLYLSDLFLLF